MRFALFASIALLFLTVVVQAGDTPAPAGAKAYFIDLEDGDTVRSPFMVRFGLAGMGIAPAGTEKEKTGHHHLFIDSQLEDTDLADNIPADDKHRHFGGGQTETSIELSPGEHTLQLVLGDQNHIPHNPPVTSPVINITVE